MSSVFRSSEDDRLPIGPVSILSHDGRILTPADLRLIERDTVGVRADGSVAAPSDALTSGDHAYRGDDAKAAANG